jgi:hypothetical protein
VKDRISVLSKVTLPTTFSRRLTASYFLGFLLFGAWEFIVNRPLSVERLQDLRREFDAIRIEPGSSPELNLPSLSGRGVAKSRSAAIAKRYNSISTCAKLFSYYDSEFRRNQWTFVRAYFYDPGTQREYRKRGFGAAVVCGGQVDYQIDLFWYDPRGWRGQMLEFLLACLIGWALVEFVARVQKRRALRPPSFP